MTITVNGNHYRDILNEFLFPKIEVEDIGNIWFKQDGVTYHTAEATLDVLRPVFEDRSCDLIPLDYYLWGAVKDKYYADKSETIDALKNIGEMQLHSNDNVLKNWTETCRLLYAQPRQPFD